MYKVKAGEKPITADRIRQHFMTSLEEETMELRTLSSKLYLKSPGWYLGRWHLLRLGRISVSIPSYVTTAVWR